MRTRILRQPVDAVKMSDAERLIKTAFLNSSQLKIITLNPEMVVNARKNLEFQAAINNANLIVPDGTGIVWAIKVLKNGNKNDLERIPGIELAERILEIANELNKKVVIFGGKKDVLQKAINELKSKSPKLQITKAIDGYQENLNEVANELAREKPDLVLVALGSPKQEIWINKHSALFPKSIMIGIGGSLDIWSGSKQRAPEIFRKLNLEWLYRTIIEPKRVIRLIRTVPIFLWMVVKEKCGT